MDSSERGGTVKHVLESSPSQGRCQELQGKGATSARCLWPAAMPEPQGPGLLLSSRSSTSETASTPGVDQQQAPASPWQEVPADILGAVVGTKLAVADVKAARLVCRQWHRAVSAGCHALQPRALKAKQVTHSFPALRSLDLKRSRRLQDSDLEELATTTSLRWLSLDGCEGVTDAALLEICKLPRLTHLSLRNCVKVTDAGLAVLAGVAPPESLWLPLLSPRGGSLIDSGTNTGLAGGADGLLPAQGRLLRSPLRSPHQQPLPGATSEDSSGTIASGLNSSDANVSGPSCSGTSSGSLTNVTASGSAAVVTGKFPRPQPLVPPLPPPPPPLQSLDLSGCLLLSEKGAIALAQGPLCRSLTALQLGGCSRVSTVTDGMLESVGRLTKLRSLDLSGCTHVTDAGLAHLTTLSNLASLTLWNCMRLSEAGLLCLLNHTRAITQLCLRGCQLGDAVLPALSPLHMLARLDMRACETVRGEEFTCLSRLSALSELNLRGCYGIIDAGLEAIGSLRPLGVLHLQECWQITTRGLAHLSGLTGLQELNLQGCRNLANTLGSPLPGLAGISSLTSLTLRSCDRLADGALDCLSRLLGLRHLDISSCKLLTGVSLAALAPLARSLASLRAQHCTGLRGPAALCALSCLTALSCLNLSGCTGGLHGTSLSALGKLSALCSLSLEGCRDLPCLDDGLALLGPHSALTSLSLQGCSTLTDRGLEALSQLPSLVTINAGDCSGISGLGCAAWEPLRGSLSALQLQNSPGVSDAGLAAIALALGGAQGALRELNLKHCRQVTDVGLAALAAELRRLTSLTLQGMVGVTDEGMASLAKMQALRDLELQFCWNFTDEGVQLLTALTELTRLDLLYSWRVSDAVLGTLGCMKSLLSLNVLGCHRLTPAGKVRVAHLLDSSLDNK